MNREELKSIFDALRNDPQHHLGLGDIRLTIAQQDAILDLFPFKDNPLPPAEGAEQRIRVRNILQDFYRRGEYELEQAEEDIMRLFQPQPTAEGAEEILESILESLGDPINIHNHAFEIRPYTVDHTTEWWIFHNGVGSGEPLTQWLSKFATLHAQKIADKMVEWISVKDKLPTQEDADEYGKVLIYRETNSDQMGMSKTIYDYAMVKYCDEQTYWMKLPDKP